MNRVLINSVFFFSWLLLASCGADPLKSASVMAKSGLSASAKACECNTSGPPVCGDGREFLNACLASCYDAKSIQVGHCNCQGHTVCGSDGQNYNECDAKNNPAITITKFIPCESQEM